jgi:hypothetical protein
VPRDQHVVRLDVAVNHALSVRELERTCDVAKNRDRFPVRKWPVATDQRAKGFALHIRHRVVRSPGGNSRRQYRDDVRMLERSRESYLAGEPLGAESCAEIRIQSLDHNFPSECSLLGQENSRHSTSAELALDGIGTSKRRLQLVEKIHRITSDDRR